MKKERIVIGFIGLALGLCMTACFELDPPADNSDAGEADAGDVDGGPQGLESVALIVTTDYQTGSYSTINLEDTSQVAKSVNTVHSDLNCQYDAVQGIPFVIGRGTASYVDVLDPEDGFDVAYEYSVKDSGDDTPTNPYDIAVVSKDRAYVSRFDTPSLLVVHPTEGTVIDTVDISAYADDDGNPEAAYMYNLEGKIYLSIQRLDSINYTSTDYSSVLVIDGASGEIEKEVKLTGTNPGARIRYNGTMDRLVIVESSDFGVFNGGIELLDPSDNSVGGFVVTEEALGGDIVDAVVVSETKGYAIVGEITDWELFVGFTSLVSFNPQTGEKLDEVLVSDSWVYNALEVNPEGTELWLADTTFDKPGIRIFDVATDAELTEDPIDVGLPPFAICFVQ